MAADFGEGHFDRPTTDKPAEDVERVGIKIGAEKGLRFEFAHWIAHQDITDGNAVAGVVPYSGAGDDLDHPFAAAVPPGHQQTAPSCFSAGKAPLEAGKAFAGVHLLAAFSASLQGVIGQLAVAPDANEITGALQLLKALPLDDVIITGDAIFTQREICRVIIDGGGDYFFTVKDNQPTLKSDIALAFGPFSPSAEWSPPPDFRRTETIEKGHGRIETRQLEVTASLAGHLAPSRAGLAQVCRLTRERIVRGKTGIETVYAITSLTADEAGPDRLLQLSRDHWGIENKLHYVRDVSCREDQSRTNAGHAPQVLAAVRNTALTLLRRLGFKPVEGFEHFAESREAAIDVVFGKRTE